MEVVVKMIDYILDIRVFDLPYHIAMVGVSVMVGYISALILIGFPVSVWEYLTKKKVPDEMERKITSIFALCLSITMLLCILYEKVK